MTEIDIPILLDDHATIPAYAHPGDAGADLTAAIKSPIILYSMERKAIPTGISVAVPDGYELQVRSRSGLALNAGVIVANSPGCVDSGFRGEVKVILINLGDKPYTIEPGMRIAQAVISPVTRAVFRTVAQLDETVRGTGGFGSSGS